VSSRPVDTAAAQLRRILHVIPYLADGEPHPLSAVADRIGVSTAELEQDLWSLVARFPDPPGGFVDGVQLYLESDSVELASDHFRRPMRLTVAELRALELGLAMIRAERPDDEQLAVDRARERLGKVIAKLPADPIPDALRYASLGATGDVQYLLAVRTALRARRKVKLTYRKSGAVSAAARVVCPYALVAVSGALYVVAHCEESHGVRIFRLDRVEGAELLAERFEVPETFSVDDVLTDGKALSADRNRVLRVRYSSRVARWIAEREGVEPAADGSVTIDHPLVDTAWAVRHVLRYGADAEVLEPAEVRDELRRTLTKMAATTTT
jgi:Predicted transcriptional regulator